MGGLAAVVLLLAAAPQENQPVSNPATVAGVYVGSLPSAGGPGRSFQLSLKLDGSAVWKEAYTDRGGIRSDGSWKVANDRVTLTFSASRDGKAQEPITWTISRNELAPAAWDHKEWGQAGPPHLRKLTGTRHIPEKPVIR